MKKLFAVSFAAALLSSCGGTNYTITGHYELPPGDSVYLHASDNSVLAAGVVGADTTISLKGTVTTPEMVSLTNRSQTNLPTFFFLEPGNIRIEGYDKLYNYHIISGTPLNDKKKAFDDAMKVFGDMVRKGVPGKTFDDILAEMKGLYTQTIDANLNNIFGAWVFDSYEFQQIKNDPEKIKARLAQFTPEMQAHPMLKRPQMQAVTAAQTGIGQPYTDLSLKNADNETIQLSSLVGPGRWVLLDFWATWCKPCMLEVPYLKKAYAAYHDKGFEIYGVSLDSDPAKWKQIIKDEGMNWVNTLRKDAGLDPTAIYNISSIPSNFLISPEGKIVAKNLRHEHLEEKLAEVLQ